MEIKIGKQFCGPSFSGHGGYTCGILAQRIDGVTEVTLRKAIPLETKLSVINQPDKSIQLLDGDTIIATAQATQFQLSLPSSPNYAEAVKASKNYIGLSEAYLYPECFCCGRNRQPGEGLRIFPGKLNGKNLVAAPWIPNNWLQNESGRIKNEFLWAALDCPGGIACMGDKIQPLLLGKFAVAIKEPPKAGQRCVVVGWQISQERRKRLAGSALYSDEGKLLAFGKATWIQPRMQ